MKGQMIEDEENQDENTPLRATKQDPFKVTDGQVIKHANRTNKNTKWYIYFLLVFSWIAQFHCISSVSVLEHTLLHKYDLTNTLYSLLYTMVFLFAIVGSLVAPKLIVKYNLYIALMITQVICIVGQMLAVISGFIIEANRNDDTHWAFFLLFLYCGRALIGVSFGLSDVILISFIGAWFGDSSHSTVDSGNDNDNDNDEDSNDGLSIIATMIAMAHQCLGTITAMYTLTLIYDIDGSLWQCFLLGVFISIASVFAAFEALRMFNQEKNDYLALNDSSNGNSDDSSVDNDDNNGKRKRDSKGSASAMEIVSDIWDGNDNHVNELYLSDFGKMRQFSLRLWLIILCITIGEANFETHFSQMIEVLIYKYNISEFAANIVLSSSPIFGMLFIPLFGYISLKYNQNNNFSMLCLAASMIGFSVSMFIVIISTNNDKGFAQPSPWIAMIIENLSIQWWWSSGWTLLYNECSIDMHPIASSVATIFYSIGNIVETLLFGVLADETGGYDASMLMVAIIPLFGFVFAVMIYFLREK